MQIRRMARPMANAMAAALMLSATAGVAFAQGHDNHVPGMSSPGPLTARQNDLVKAVRAATERFKNVTSVDGPGEGYNLVLGCVSGGDFGAMGLHYLNGSLVFDGGEIRPDKPEIILFEPTRDGGIRITGADFLVLASDWAPKHTHPA